MSIASEILTLNARIESVSMSLDRDIFLCGWVHLERADGFHQGFGGFVLGGTKDATKAGRHDDQPNLAAIWLVGIMQAAEVTDYAKAVGQIVRIRVGAGWGSEIQAIGHALKDDRWFTPREALNKAGPIAGATQA